MPSQKGRRCVDCAARGERNKRVAKHPGPRCATHWREVRTSRRDVAHERHLLETYNLTSEDYWALYEAQGRHCAICPSTGAKRRLSVDHDHKCCKGPISCGECVRGLLCRPCNTMLGRLRDDPHAFERAAAYLKHPPTEGLWNVAA